MKDFTVYLGLVGNVAPVAVYAVELFRPVLDKKAQGGSISAQTTLHDLGWERASVWVGFPGKYGEVSICWLVHAKYGTESCDESPLAGKSNGLGGSSQPVAHPTSCPFLALGVCWRYALYDGGHLIGYSSCLSVFYSEDHVTVPQCACAMRDHHRRPSLHQAFDGVKDQGLRVNVQRACRLVEYENWCVLQKCSRERDSLTFATGQFHASLSYEGIVPVWKAGDEVVRVRVPSCGKYFLDRRFRPRESNVLSY